MEFFPAQNGNERLHGLMPSPLLPQALCGKTYARGQRKNSFSFARWSSAVAFVYNMALHAHVVGARMPL